MNDDIRKYNKKAIKSISRMLGIEEEKVPALVENIAELVKPTVAKFTGRRTMLAAGLGGLLTMAATPALGKMTITDQYIDLDGQTFYPATYAPYRAIVYKSGGLIIAEDWSGKIIAQGIADTEDTTVIQTAINYVNNVGGGRVFVRRDTYSASVTVKENVHLELEIGVSGITANPDSSGTVVIQDVGEYKLYESGVQMPLYPLPYSAMVYIEGGSVIAEDWKGSKIAEGEAGVDDRYVINTALQQGGVIFIRQGTYVFDDRLSLATQNVKVIGEGMGRTVLTVVEGYSDNYFADVRALNITLSNLTLDANNDVSTTAYVRSSGTKLKVDRVEVRNGISYGFYFGAVELEIINCYIHDINSRGIAGTSAAQARIINNLIENCGFGIDAPFTDAVIAYNTIRYVDLTGIAITAGARNVVIGNIIKNSDTPASGMDSIYCDSIKTVIANNVCLNSGDSGIAVEWDTPEVIIVGNHIEGAWYQGIYLTSPRCICKGNIVKNCGQSGTSRYGIRVGVDSSRADYNIIVENICFDDQSTKTQQYGIYGDGADYCIIKDNILTGNASGAIGGSFGGNCIQANNIT